jgi:hypothetical protein
VEQLRAEVEQLRRAPQGGGLLSSLFGGGQRAPEPPRPQAGSPWGHRPAPQGMPYQGHGMPPQAPMGQGYGAPGPWGGMAARGGGGFLQNAMATAAGVAGGMMIANALSNAFGGDAAAEATKAASDVAGLSGGEGGGEGGEAGGFGGITDSLYQDASAQEDLGGDDFGTGDDGDWA